MQIKLVKFTIEQLYLPHTGMSFSFSLQEPNLKIPPLIKQEVKQEPDAAPSINLPPSTCYLEDPAIKNQSTLLNMLNYIQSMRALFQAKEPKTLPWKSALIL